MRDEDGRPNGLDNILYRGSQQTRRVGVPPGRDQLEAKRIERRNWELGPSKRPPLRGICGVGSVRPNSKINPGSVQLGEPDSIEVPDLWSRPAGTATRNEIGNIDGRATADESSLPSFTTIRRRFPSTASARIAVDHDQRIPVPKLGWPLVTDVCALDAIVAVDRGVFVAAQGNGSPSDEEIALLRNVEGSETSIVATAPLCVISLLTLHPCFVRALPTSAAQHETETKDRQWYG